MEDRSGKLWIGTREELCYYDGKAFTIVKNDDGKTFNNVWGITEDRKGNIWFGATILEDRKNKNWSDAITAEDKRDNRLTISSGIWRYDGITYTKVSNKGAYAILQDKKGNIWTTGGDGPPVGGQVWSLSRYDAQSLYNENPTVTIIKSQSNSIGLLGILEATDGSIWFGSGNGVYRYDGKTITDFRK
jgi:ligand-binding sensor domain-containing protein